jgi:V8-like Glu-specific endopeptidase
MPLELNAQTQMVLREALTGLYWEVKAIQVVARDTGLNMGRIGWNESAQISWQNVLDEANKQGRVKDLARRVLQDYPNEEQVKLAVAGELTAIPTPSLPAGELARLKSGGTLEKIIGAASTFRPVAFLERGTKAARSVCRVVLPLKPGEDKPGTGSGFLIDGSILITNHHVLPDAATARAAHVEFNYQTDELGADLTPTAYDLDPDAPDGFFATSPLDEQNGDDWTAVKVKGDPATKWGTLRIFKLEDGTPKEKDEVIVIQHPGGGRKQIALSHNTVVDANDRRVQYLTDTAEGSSGSPVFDVKWRVVALHHAGDWLTQPGIKKPVYSNQGIHINLIIQGLEREGMF